MATSKTDTAKRPVGRPRKSGDEKSTKGAKNSKAGMRAQGEHIFALDIGTRTIVGMVGIMQDDIFRVLDCEVVAHPKRAMIDGQIEDIAQVAKIAGLVKEALERRLKMRLTHVSIAAAGRALKTQRVTVEHDVEGRDLITADLLKSMEIETIQQAQAQLDASGEDTGASFYCVGHSVISYALDDYPILSLTGHKGKRAKIELIAAFLPSPVVESLYAVVDQNKLTVSNLTLEPIAAMNVIIPKEIRLINIALVDIGAGTSDIAIAKDGSIVAYAMATVAGDEITEEIIRKYLVSFDTAEQMKQSAEDTIAYKDILGMEHTVSRAEFFESLTDVVEVLATTVCDSILSVNGTAPAAIFLVGGGSRIPALCDRVAERLGIPKNRVAVGGRDFIKNLTLPSPELSGPEFVTPIGIAVTATLGQSYDFSTVTLNGDKIRVFNTKALTVLELLSLSKFKPSQLMGRTGRSLTFTVNGSKRVIKGGHFTPAEIYVNDKPASIETPVSQGDAVIIIPAVNGAPAQATVADVLSGARGGQVYIAGNAHPFGPRVRLNGREVGADYPVQNFDELEIDAVATLGDLIRPLALPTADYDLAIGGKVMPLDYILHDGDVITLQPKERSTPAKPDGERVTLASQLTEKPRQAPGDTAPAAAITVTLNGRKHSLLPKEDDMPHLFFDLLNYTDIDPQHPQGSGELVLTRNGANAGYTDPLCDGDVIVIGWK